jgi:hypothetical protein
VTGAWRVGRHVGRTVYRQLGSFASGDDELIGVMDTPELAAEAVAARNAAAAAAVPAVAPQGLRERIGYALSESIDDCARCKVCDKQVDAVMAVLAEGTTP